MRAKERTVLMQAVLAAGILSLSLAATFNAASAQDKTYVMKITLPTLNDTIHQVAKNYAAALEKDFSRPHQGSNLSGEPVGFNTATDRGRAVRRYSMRNDPAGILCWCR